MHGAKCAGAKARRGGAATPEPAPRPIDRPDLRPRWRAKPAWPKSSCSSTWHPNRGADRRCRRRGGPLAARRALLRRRARAEVARSGGRARRDGRPHGRLRARPVPLPKRRATAHRAGAPPATPAWRVSRQPAAGPRTRCRRASGCSQRDWVAWVDALRDGGDRSAAFRRTARVHRFPLARRCVRPSGRRSGARALRADCLASVPLWREGVGASLPHGSDGADGGRHGAGLSR